LFIFQGISQISLEYANSVWYQKTDVDKLEQVQTMATKLIPELAKKPYGERLRILDLPTLNYRRHRGDMIRLFKMIKGVQGVPIKNNPLEKMLYFSHDSTDKSQTVRLCMRVFTQHKLQVL